MVEVVSRSGLGGLILEAIDSHGVDAPVWVVRQLRASAQRVARLNNCLTTQLQPMLSALNRAHIPVMLLKGAALNNSVYAAPELRPMSDVDLLVRESDALRAVAVLKQAGCREGMSLLREDFFPTYYYETELLSDDPDPLRVDLHARPLRPLRYARMISEDAFWCDAQRVAVGRSYACMPSTEVMFVHLAAHAAFHGCSRLIWLYDLKRWADAHESSIDWTRLLRLCITWRLALAVAEAVHNAERRFGSFVPVDVLPELHASRSSLRDRLTLRQAARDAGSSWLPVLTNLLCTPGWRFRAGYLWALLRPGRGHLADVYPYRHPGWPIVAGLYRMVRASARLISGVARRLPLAGRLFGGSHATNGHPGPPRGTGAFGMSGSADAPTSACPGL